MRKIAVIGLLGPTLDKGQGKDRWARWRPTVSLFQQEDLLVERFEMLHPSRSAALAQTVTRDIAQVSPETSVHAHALDMTNPWDLEEVYGALYDFARAYPFDTDTYDYLVHITTGTHIAQICLFLLAEARYFPAKLIQTSPHGYGIIDLDLSKYDKLAGRFAREQNEAVSFLKAGIDTRNAAFNQLMQRIEQVALGSSEPLLLTGATGSGKSALANRIYQLKKARGLVSGELVDVNCATLRGDTAMATLFGHSKGAFTGATDARGGLLRKAHGGVLFLDEVGELGNDEQAMLLRAIEDKRFYPVGSDKEVSSDFQLIAGTNRDLADGFREDLLARINQWSFRLPSLRERPEDIEPNLDHELAQQKTRVTFNHEARAKFLRFALGAPWPANFRDFGAAVRRMATLAAGGRISAADVEEELGRLRAAWSKEKISPSTALLGGRTLDRFDRVQLDEVLTVCRHSKSMSEAGRTLFAASFAEKQTKNDADRLRKYLARFGLEWKDVSQC